MPRTAPRKALRTSALHSHEGLRKRRLSSKKSHSSELQKKPVWAQGGPFHSQESQQGHTAGAWGPPPRTLTGPHCLDHACGVPERSRPLPGSLSIVPNSPKLFSSPASTQCPSAHKTPFTRLASLECQGDPSTSENKHST